MVQITFGGLPIQLNVGENTGEARRAAARAEAAAGAAEDTLGELEPAKDAALLEIGGAQTTAVAAVAAEGDAKIALATAQADRAETAADAAEAARDDVTDARDTIVAAAGLTPTRAAAKPTLFFNSAGGSYVDLPSGTNPPATAARDWYIAFEYVASAMAGSGTNEYLLSSGAASGGNTRHIYMPEIGAGSNKRLMLQSLQLASTQFIRNATYRSGAASVMMRPLDQAVGVLASINGIPHLAIMRSDGSYLASKGDTNFASTGGWFFGGTLTVTGIARTSNNLIVTGTGTPFGGAVYNVGNSIFVPGIGARVITAKTTSQLTCYDPGVDATGLGTTIAYGRTEYTGLTRVFDRIGALGSDGSLHWQGGAQRMLVRHGTTNLPGELSSALVDGDGYIKQSFLASLVDGTYKTLPGADIATIDLTASTIGTGSAFPAASQPTITGTTRKGTAVDQPSWLRLKPGQNLHNRVHAQEFGQDFGTVKVVFQSDAMPFGATVTVYDRHPDEAGAAAVLAEQPLFSIAQSDPDNIEAVIHLVPANSGYWARAALASVGPEVDGSSSYYVDFPCMVGPVQVDLQQSLTGVAMGIFTGYASASVSAGIGGVAGNWTGGSVNAGTAPGAASDQTLSKTYGYSSNLRINSGATWPDQLKKWANVYLDGATAKYSRNGACMFVPLIRSGHSKTDFINDGLTFRVAAGTCAAGVSFTPTVNPFTYANNKWLEPGTVKIYANGSLVAQDDYVSRTTNTAPWTNSVTGSVNYNNWSGLSITLPYAATIEVEGRVIQSSGAANNASRLNYGAEVTGDNYSYFGIDDTPGSGNMLDNIYQTTGITAFLDSWLYYTLGTIGSGVSLASAKAILLAGITGVRDRLLQYPQFTNPRTGEPIPWFLVPEQRVTIGGTSQQNQQYGRYVYERLVADYPDLFRLLPGCLTCQIDSASGPHNDALGSIHIFQQKALALASAMGLISGDHHKIVRVIGGTRLSANSIRLYLTPTPHGIGQHDAAATTFAGLWYSATNDLWASAYVDTSTWTYTINNSATNPYIDLDKGSALAGGYFDLNRYAVVPSTAGTLSAQNTLLTKTLCVLNGGYDALLTRRGDDIHYSDTLAGIAIT